MYGSGCNTICDVPAASSDLPPSRLHADAQADADAAAAAEARQILELVRSLRRGLLQDARAELTRNGLTGAQLSLVSLLGTRGPLTVSELSRELALGHSTVSGIVDRLQARGIVERHPDALDRRFTRVRLTETLRQKAPNLIAHGPGSRMLAALAAATPEQRRTMRDGLVLLQQFLR
jgi:DNA-binding MarR family transcriptional regulator